MNCRGHILLLALGGSLSAAELHVPEQHPSLQHAIDAATAGDTILVAPGTYPERIALKPGITLRSRGSDVPGERAYQRAELTVIDGNGKTDDTPGVTMAEGATLDGFTITHVGEYDEARWQEHWQERGSNQKHEHIGHFGVPAVAVVGVNCQVLNNVVRHNGDIGIAVRGKPDRPGTTLIAGNFCHRNMGGGIGSMMGSTAVIRNNECFENFYAGIGQDDASPTITDNDCHHNIRAGIGISEGSSPIVSKNRCHHNRRAGIGIRTGATTRPLVMDNDCHDNGMAGIGVEEQAAPLLRQNRCRNNRLAGIGCQEHSTPLLVENLCLENASAGIGISSANPILIGNRCEQNRTAGIGISGDSHAILLGNQCVDNRLVAVGLPDGGTALLRENTLVRAGKGPPMVAVLKGARVTLTDNTIRGGGGAGIIVDGQLIATGNTITGQNGGVGIAVRANGTAVLRDNQIAGYRVPVRALKKD